VPIASDTPIRKSSQNDAEEIGHAAENDDHQRDDGVTQPHAGWAGVPGSRQPRGDRQNANPAAKVMVPHAVTLMPSMQRRGDFDGWPERFVRNRFGSSSQYQHTGQNQRYHECHTSVRRRMTLSVTNSNLASNVDGVRNGWPPKIINKPFLPG